MNETTSILILALFTIILAIWTFVSMRWWLKNNERFYKLCNGYLALPFWLTSIVAIIIAPGGFLGYLINDIKLVKDIGTNGRFFVFLGWIMPTGIYIINFLVRKIKSEKK